MCLAAEFALVTSVGHADPETRVLQVAVDGSHAIDAAGRGSVVLSIHVMDADSTPFPKDTAIRALILHGDARLRDGLSADLTADETSNVALTIYPGTQAGPLVIRFTAGDAQGDLDLVLTVDVRKPLVVGFATGGIGPVPGWTEAQDGAPDGTTARRGAISVYGTGEISKNTRGTFAYDSSDTLAQTIATDPFLDNPNDRPFPTYGDASIRYDDALSTNHFFAAIQNGRSSAMWGQFYAQAGPSTVVGGYNLLVNGAKVSLGGNVVGVGGFTAQNNIAFARTIISPTGLAISSQALQPDIVIGSDVLTLVHLDRRSGAVLSESVLGRGTDYVIDYASGLLSFLNILLPYDDQFNPQVVVVQYEYGGPGATSTLLGGKAYAMLSPGTRADAWYLNDALGNGNLTLVGQSIAGKTPNTVWSVSHEHTDGFLPITTAQYGNGGDAFRAAFTTKDGPVKVTLSFAGTDAAYDNPYGSYTAPGLVSFNGDAAYALSRISTLELSYLFAHNALPVSQNDAGRQQRGFRNRPDAARGALEALEILRRYRERRGLEQRRDQPAHDRHRRHPVSGATRQLGFAGQFSAGVYLGELQRRFRQHDRRRRRRQLAFHAACIDRPGTRPAAGDHARPLRSTPDASRVRPRRGRPRQSVHPAAVAADLEPIVRGLAGR